MNTSLPLSNSDATSKTQVEPEPDLLAAQINEQLARSLAGIKEELGRFADAQKTVCTAEILKASVLVLTRLSAKVEDTLRPIQKRTEELNQLASQVGETSTARRWRDRVMGMGLATVAFLVGLEIGMVIR